MNHLLLTARELYLLCETAAAPWPLPLPEPPTARTWADHLADNRRVSASLRAKGLADHRGPTGHLADLVTALPGDRVHWEGASGVAVGVRGGGVAFAVRPSGSGSDVTVTPCLPDLLPDVLLAAEPVLPPADCLPLTAPAAAVAAAGRAPAHGAWEVLTAHGVTGSSARGWTTLLASALGGGMCTVRPRGHRSGDARTSPVRWLDTRRGRLLVVERDGWLSANPLPQVELRRLVAGACG
ncbi:MULTISPECIES: ESX secretion-associated protein EspG [Actinosynnema]|uniref:ESX secretion-associated protein EspG n=1 Tax=Actinosynnema TaxID=40566 RepID=UPI0020A2CFB8|nr:ESX secretion-associated protein EspG [Actinosynnema pretiosum]MCP2094814.1 EspG family protein [Actinosynnema pretiosum]